jgi:hypothetical protein
MSGLNVPLLPFFSRVASPHSPDGEMRADAAIRGTLASYPNQPGGEGINPKCPMTFGGKGTILAVKIPDRMWSGQWTHRCHDDN